jgi:polysaccharide export outer membrane protein
LFFEARLLTNLKRFNVLTAKLGTCIIGTALAFHGMCFAQSAQHVSGANGYGQPMDLRVGIAQPVATSSDNITDGGLRTAPTPQKEPATVITLGKDYKISPNDLVDIEIAELDNFKKTTRVNAAGAISLPLVGQVTVAGLTPHEMEERIADRYREKYIQNPQVSVFVKEFAAERITVEGAVGRPGMFPLTGKMTLLRVLAVAGGFASIADSSHVMLYRTNEKQEREVIVYNVDKIRAGADNDPPIHGDDLIVVQRDSTRALLKDSLFRDVIDSINPFSVLTPK